MFSVYICARVCIRVCSVGWYYLQAAVRLSCVSCDSTRPHWLTGNRCTHAGARPEEYLQAAVRAARFARDQLWDPSSQTLRRSFCKAPSSVPGWVVAERPCGCVCDCVCVTVCACARVCVDACTVVDTYGSGLQVWSLCLTLPPRHLFCKAQSSECARVSVWVREGENVSASRCAQPQHAMHTTWVSCTSAVLRVWVV